MVYYGSISAWRNSADPLPIQLSLGVLHSYPDWIVEVWLEQLGLEQTEQL